MISQVAHLKISEPSEDKFTTFSIIALAVLQKNFISNFNAITFQMPKVITVLLSFLCLFNVFYLQLESSFLRSCRLQKCIEHIFAKGSSKFGRSSVFFMSILCVLHDPLCSSCQSPRLLFFCTKAQAGILCGPVFGDAMSKKHTFTNIWPVGKVAIQYFINKFLIVLFCLSTRPFACRWHALVTRWMVPVRRCNSGEILLTNS